MVLFLFIIMLLDLRAEQLRKINYVAVAGGSAVAIVFFLQIYFVVRQLNAAQQPFPALAAKTGRRPQHRRRCSSPISICRSKSSACSSWWRRSVSSS